MVVSSPDKRVQEALRDNAGKELAEYRRMVVEAARAKAGGARRLTRQQARANDINKTVHRIIKAADRRGSITTTQKGSRPARKGTISRNVRAILERISFQRLLRRTCSKILYVFF